MDLLLTERARTYAAHLQYKEWTEYNPCEISLDELISWIQRRRADDRPMTASVKSDDNTIIIDFTNEIGIVRSQMIVDCNADDREKLLQELSQVCA